MPPVLQHFWCTGSVIYHLVLAADLYPDAKTYMLWTHFIHEFKWVGGRIGAWICIWAM